MAEPDNAEEGAGRVRLMLVQMFDRKDGSGADWSLMLKSLFLAGFQITAGRPDDEARRALMRRVHEVSYEHMKGDAETGTTGAAGPGAAPSNTAGPKSPGPRSPR